MASRSSASRTKSPSSTTPQAPKRPAPLTATAVASAERCELLAIRVLDEAAWSKLQEQDAGPYEFDGVADVYVVGPGRARHFLEYTQDTGRDLDEDIRMALAWHYASAAQASYAEAWTTINNSWQKSPPILPTEPSEEEAAAYLEKLAIYQSELQAAVDAELLKIDPTMTVAKVEALRREMGVAEDRTPLYRTFSRPFNGTVVGHVMRIAAHLLSRYERVVSSDYWVASSFEGLGAETVPSSAEDVLSSARPDFALAEIIHPTLLDAEGRPARMSTWLYLLERTGVWSQEQLAEAMGIPKDGATNPGKGFLHRSSVKL